MADPGDHRIRPVLFFSIMTVLVIAVVVLVIRVVPRRPNASNSNQNATLPMAGNESAHADDHARPVDSAADSERAARDANAPVPGSSDSATNERRSAANPDEATANGEGSRRSPVPPPTRNLRPSAPSIEGGTENDNTAADPCADVAGWRLGPVRTATSVFGFRTGSDGGARYASVAPRDRRYLWLTVALTRTADTAGSLRAEPDGADPPTLTLTGEAQYLPVGFRGDVATPWSPLEASPIVVEPDAEVQHTIGFFVPNVLTRATLVLEGVPCEDIEWPAAPPLSPHELVGDWVRSPALASSIRYQDAVADAIAERDRPLLRVEPAGVDSVRLTFPGPVIMSTPVEKSSDGFVGSLRLRSGGAESAAWIRPIDGTSLLLLYVGEGGDAVFLFQPAG